MEFPDEIERVSQVYNTQYRPDPKDRSYPWNARNPLSIYYRQSQERALITLFNDLDIDLEPLLILDVGCGSGSYLRFLASIGATPGNLHGVDLMDYRIENARMLSPASIDYSVGNAQNLAFPAYYFDIVSQFTVFSSILDSGLRKEIAREIDRVIKPGGYLLWYDMTIGNTTTTQGIELGEIIALFPNYARQSVIKLHPIRAASLVKRSMLLAEIAEGLPGLKKTHLLCLLKKPIG